MKTSSQVLRKLDGSVVFAVAVGLDASDVEDLQRLTCDPSVFSVESLLRDRKAGEPIEHQLHVLTNLVNFLNLRDQETAGAKNALLQAKKDRTRIDNSNRRRRKNKKPTSD